MTPDDFFSPEAGMVLVLAVLAFWCVGAYNRLLRLRNAASTAWRGVDELLVARVRQVEQFVEPLRESRPQDRDVIEAALAAGRQTLIACEAARERPLVSRHLHGVSLALQVLQSSIAALPARLGATDEGSEPVADAAATFESLAAQAARLDFGAQQFNGAVETYNAAALQIPTRVVATLFGLREARTLDTTRRDAAAS